jgi:hypothetical protein
MAGPAQLRWSTWSDEDEEAEDPGPTAEGGGGEDDSSEDEKPAPEDYGDDVRTPGQATSLLDPPSRYDIAHLGFVDREHGDFGGGGPLER